jgi:hypothetical protein
MHLAKFKRKIKEMLKIGIEAGTEIKQTNP